MEEGTLYSHSTQVSSSSARDALLGNNESPDKFMSLSQSPSANSMLLADHNTRLEDSTRMASDAEKIGHSILESLRRQREQLEHINFSVLINS